MSNAVSASARRMAFLGIAFILQQRTRKHHPPTAVDLYITINGKNWPVLTIYICCSKKIKFGKESRGHCGHTAIF